MVPPCATGDAHLEAHLDRLIDEVTALLGGPLPPAYEAAVRAVPRHVFLPDRLWLRDGEGGYRPCERAADPDEWMTAAYSDSPLVTQFTDGLPSSSASMPSMVLRTLLLAELTPHRKGSVQRVLELGTGTGFNAALLCALCGNQAVTTLELDPRLAARGEENLKSAGYTPTVVCTDAAGGWAPRAPYDRIVATFSVDHIPTAWLRQLSPGGRIVTPWTSAWCGYGTASLTGRQDGGADGRFHGFASFMPMRSPSPSPDGIEPAGESAVPGPGRVSGLSPWSVAGGDLDAEFHIGLTVPGACFAWDASGEHAHTRLHITDDTTLSWATVDYDGQHPDRFTVTEAGPRALWAEVEATYARWEQLGRPAVDRYGLSVTPNGGQTLWVNHPGRDHTVPVAARP